MEKEPFEAIVIPASYAEYGKVWLAELLPPQGEGTNAKEVFCPPPGHTSSIIVEFQDVEKMVLEQFKEAGGVLNFLDIEDRKDLGIVKYAFKPKDARYLVVHLLDALCEGGDQIAVRLQEAFDQVMESAMESADEKL